MPEIAAEYNLVRFVKVNKVGPGQYCIEHL